MKKTIAKIMAAAMVLSAVPAVAMPTFESQAATSITKGTVSASNVENGSTITLDKDGGTGVLVGSDYKVSSDGHTLTIGDNTIKIEKVASSTNATKFFDLVKISVNSDGEVLVTANATSSESAQVAVNAIKAKENAVTFTVDTTTSAAIMNNDVFFATSKSATIWVGGEYNSSTGKITTGVQPAGSKNTVALPDGAVQAAFDKNGVEILKNPTTDLDSYDTLRGETIDLTTVRINGGVTLPVIKLGAQALKKGHFKKFYAENVKRIGKGALRKAKQLKHADFQDSNKIRKINSKAFYDCKNLKTIIIDGRKLKTVGKDAFHGVKKNCTVKIKAKKSKYESDKKMILKNGGNKNLKFVRK